mmetsp:Transcript_27660/g.91924  ORF Transcript_27660/g.91924 Transcript_27660/m.91924 type:complete len:340 (+) Transcript_27660:55-1074(+)
MLRAGRSVAYLRTTNFATEALATYTGQVVACFRTLHKLPRGSSALRRRRRPHCRRRRRCRRCCCRHRACRRRRRCCRRSRCDRGRCVPCTGGNRAACRSIRVLRRRLSIAAAADAARNVHGAAGGGSEAVLMRAAPVASFKRISAAAAPSQGCKRRVCNATSSPEVPRRRRVCGRRCRRSGGAGGRRLVVGVLGVVVVGELAQGPLEHGEAVPHPLRVLAHRAPQRGQRRLSAPESRVRGARGGAGAGGLGRGGRAVLLQARVPLQGRLHLPLEPPLARLGGLDLVLQRRLLVLAPRGAALLRLEFRAQLPALQALTGRGFGLRGALPLQLGSLEPHPL